jgi:Rps23 Pro-64 3,4-dihydroxylase Tpa1-like proline 4-hydroxylase
MSDAQREAMKRLGAPTGLKGFRFFFEQIVVALDEAGPQETATPLGRFAAFMSSAPVLELFRRVTGKDDIAFADARATAYGPDHFLTMHHDEAEGSRRRAAYVFGLTEAWRPEWGGLLLFHDEGDDVVQGLMPRMNALTLFDVPQDHSVSLVSRFVPGPRYSVTGWMRARAGARLPPHP